MNEQPTQPRPEEGVIDVNREFEVKEPQKLDDGKHSGEITKILYRELPFSYLDVYVKPDNSELELKIGFPQNVSLNSALGQLLERFGVDLESGKKVNPYNVLVSKKVEFVTISEVVKFSDGRAREFSRIVRESLKPLKEN